jgi:hypothetical protein
MLLYEDVYQQPPISGLAPTAASTGSALSSASSGLENLLKLAVGGYTSIIGAKAAATKAKTELAQANQTGVTGVHVADAPASGLSGKTVLMIAAGVAAVIVGISVLRPSKG